MDIERMGKCKVSLKQEIINTVITHVYYAWKPLTNNCYNLCST